MEKYIITLLIVLNIGVANAQSLTVGNGDSYTVSGTESYTSVELKNEAVLNIPNGATLTTSALTVNNNAIINLDGILIINGNVTVKNDGSLTVNNTGTMEVSGDLTANNNSNLTLDGNVQIDGNLNAPNSNIVVNGSVNVDGTFTGEVSSGTGSLTSGNSNNYNPLPVKLLYAKATSNKQTVTLEWSTSAELNNNYFSIQTSSNMSEWIELTKKQGVGTTNTTTVYKSSFEPTESGIVYIRLSQTDYDGTTEILKTLTVEIDAQKRSIYPMPLKSGQEWHIKGLQTTDHVKLYNTAMQIVQDSKNLNKGFYYVIINDKEVHKLIVE